MTKVRYAWVFFLLILTLQNLSNNKACLRQWYVRSIKVKEKMTGNKIMIIKIPLKRHWKDTLWRNDQPSSLQDCNIWLLYLIPTLSHTELTRMFSLSFGKKIVDRVTDWVSEWVTKAKTRIRFEDRTYQYLK